MPVEKPPYEFKPVTAPTTGKTETPVETPATPATPATATPTPATTTPTATTATTPTTATPVKTEEERSVEIFNNLTEGLKNAPQLFQDRNAFNKAYNYDSKPANEKAILDSFFASNQPDNRPNQLAAILASRGKLPLGVAGTENGMLAQHIYDTAKPYLNASSDTLLAGMNTGKIVP